MLGGVTDAIDAASTMTAGWALPPFSFAGTYGRNSVVLLFWSVVVCFSSLIPDSSFPSADRRGRFRRDSQAFSKVLACPQIMWLNWSFQPTPGVGPVLSMTTN